MPVMTLHAPCLVNHEGVVCCSDRKGFAGASLFTAYAPVHCTGYQILRPHFQTCGPNIEKMVEENLAQRLKVRAAGCVAVAAARHCPPSAGHVRSSQQIYRVAAVQEFAHEAAPFERSARNTNGRPSECQ
jgi:hypothetical protein